MSLAPGTVCIASRRSEAQAGGVGVFMDGMINNESCWAEYNSRIAGNSQAGRLYEVKIAAREWVLSSSARIVGSSNG